MLVKGKEGEGLLEGVGRGWVEPEIFWDRGRNGLQEARKVLGKKKSASAFYELGFDWA